MKKMLSALLAAATVATLGVTAFAATEYDITIPYLYDKNDASISVDTVVPDSKIYVGLEDVKNSINTAVSGSDVETAMLNDEDFFKFKYKKGSDNSKMIKSIKLVEKELGASRKAYIEVKLNDTYTDDEYKINPEFTFSAKEDIGSSVKDGDKFTFDFTMWIQNNEDNADKDYLAGTGGVVLKPNSNDDNEIVWEDENDDIAKLVFEADDDAGKFYPKLSTKWDNEVYAAMFADQDAFIFDFVGNPTIDSTSRPVLFIFDPYFDSEDDTTIDPDTVVIYEVIDDELVDVTDKFAYVETEDGDLAYTCKTRTLGTYIFCEAEVAGEEEVVEEEKVIPNTGR